MIMGELFRTNKILQMRILTNLFDRLLIGQTLQVLSASHQ